eukprot:3347672-Prymnesium_polylepis.2
MEQVRGAWRLARPWVDRRTAVHGLLDMQRRARHVGAGAGAIARLVLEQGCAASSAAADEGAGDGAHRATASPAEQSARERGHQQTDGGMGCVAHSSQMRSAPEGNQLIRERGDRKERCGRWPMLSPKA